MHGETEGGRKNEKVYPNPMDPEPMYIAKRQRHDVITKFANKPYNWKYCKKISSTHKKPYLLAMVEFFTTLLLIEISIVSKINNVNN